MPPTTVPGRQIRDQSVGTADLADQAVTFPKLAAHPAGGLHDAGSNQTGVKIADGSPLFVDSNGLDIVPVRARNVVINGNFNIWQRGTSFPSAGDGTYTADRWQMVIRNATGRFDVSQLTTTIGDLTAVHCLRHVVSTADADVGANDVVATVYTVEGYDLQALRAQTMTLSFWLWSNVTGVMHVAFRSPSGNGSYVEPVVITQAETWTHRTITLGHSLGVGTWAFDNAAGMQIAFVWSGGFNVSVGGTTGEWIGADLWTGQLQTNFLADEDNEVRIAQVQLEHGPVATPFEHLPFSLELMRCQRYFETSFPLGIAPAQGAGIITAGLSYAVQNAGTTRFMLTVPYAVQKRTSPTVTFYNPVSANGAWYNNDRGADSGTPVLQLSHRHAFIVNNNQVAGDAVGQRCYINWSADAEF